MTAPRLCNSGKSDGRPCLAPATHSSPRCRHHQRQASRDHRRTLALNPGRTVRLGPLHSRPAILRTLNRVVQLLAAGTLSPDRAGRALRRVQLVGAAIRRGAKTPLSPTAVPLSARLANLLEPGIPNLEPGSPHLLSLIQPPTIEENPRPFSVPLNPQSKLSLERTAVNAHPHPKPATDHGQRTTDHG